MVSPYRLYGGATRPDALNFDPAFGSALDALYAAAPPEVQRELGLNSGYRDRATQTRLFNASDRSGRTVARPGHSRHESGQAADLFGFGLKGGGSVSQATRDWVHQNAGRFGLGFPMDYEPWHIQMLAGGGGNDQLVGSSGGGQTTEDQIRAAFLSSLAGTEAPAYNTLYGGGTFTDYAQHPNRQIPIMSGPNRGDYSTAAGRYQFLKGTWDQEAAKLGLKDFSAQSQDAAAWDLADTEYKRLTKGGSLIEALQSGDPARLNAAANILNKVWTSLPGGSEQAKMYGGGGKTFADIYQQNLGKGRSAFAGSTATGPAASPYSLPKDDKKSKLGDVFGDAVAGMGGGGQWKMPELPAEPDAARVDAPAAQPIWDPQQQQANRDRLAQVMAALNGGRAA